jgi:Zn ribbon nucleic-acid-binding protein
MTDHMRHERRCFDCGNVAIHEGDIVPLVNCHKCGSQDTRRKRKTDLDENKPNYQWRPAAKFDIGSVARFGDTNSEHEPWSYGILKAVVKDEMYGWQYTCEANCYLDEDEKFMHCQIQYDANQNP